MSPVSQVVAVPAAMVCALLLNLHLQEVVSTADFAKKIKRLYISSAADFKAQEAKHEGQTGEGTESAADWCAEDDQSEVGVMCL